jgi:hypothetical protein
MIYRTNGTYAFSFTRSYNRHYFCRMDRFEVQTLQQLRWQSLYSQ